MGNVEVVVIWDMIEKESFFEKFFWWKWGSDIWGEGVLSRGNSKGKIFEYIVGILGWLEGEKNSKK